jgi:phosphoglycolate phosphatase
MRPKPVDGASQVQTKAVVFDLDGTLMDTHAAIVRCFQEAASPRQLDGEAISSLIGLPLVEMFTKLLPTGDIPSLVASYSSAYPEMDRRLSRWFPGVIPLVDGLRERGCRCAIATSKSRAGLERVLAESGYGGRFSVAMSNDDVSNKKPHPDMLLTALARLEVAAQDAVMVGDTSYDITMGRAAGVRTIGVLWGAHGPQRMAHADVLVATIDELMAALD